jgi:hypothetical protein
MFLSKLEGKDLKWCSTENMNMWAHPNLWQLAALFLGGKLVSLCSFDR